MKKRAALYTYNRVHKKTFVLKSNEVTGDWKRLNKEELNGLYSSPNVSHVAGEEKLIQGFGGKI